MFRLRLPHPAALACAGILAFSATTGADLPTGGEAQKAELPAGALTVVQDGVPQAFVSMDAALMGSLLAEDYRYVESDTLGRQVMALDREGELSNFRAVSGTQTVLSSRVAVTDQNWEEADGGTDEEPWAVFRAVVHLSVVMSATPSDTFAIESPATLKLRETEGRWQIVRWEYTVGE